ncbi:MAG: SH3 domain-containing protein [Dysgonamonadaceae bacterium]|jgi:hypothetical protein|nr:SH3 domain-containing protein [Dysgonamonadaceae bacterium]
MKAVKITAIFAMFNIASHAQDCSKENIRSVNTMNLYRVYIVDGKFSATPKYFEGAKCWYLDGDAKLRKYFDWSSYPESLSKYLVYYDESGQMAYFLFKDSNPEGYSYWGRAHTGCGPYYNHLEFDYTVQFEWETDFWISRTHGKSSAFPQTIGNHTWLSMYCHVDSFIHRAPTLPQECIKVRFAPPRKGNKTFTNDHNIVLREKPSIASAKLQTLEIGRDVTVLEIAQEETIGDMGAHHWFKVQLYNVPTTGYIYGAFLEPVEQEIKE